MSKIHMETEDVRETARLLDWTAGELYPMPPKLRNLASSISSAWQGGRAEDYSGEIYRQAENLQREVLNLQRLAVRVGGEVGEWENADGNGARAIKSQYGYLLPGSGVLFSTLPATIISQNLTFVNGQQVASEEDGFIKDWESGIDVTFSDKWTKSDGWGDGTDLGIEAKFNLIEGTYIEGESSSNWQMGQYDIGGTVGEYGISQGEAGAQFGWDEKGLVAGAYGEYDLVDVSAGAVFGGSLLGLTLNTGGSAGSAEGFVGYKDGTVGASIGASAIAGELGLGLNVAGANVGVKAGLELGFELGIKIGAETEVKVGPFKIGLSFGKAITD